MSGFEVNKILATFIVAILCFIIIDYIGDSLVNPDIPKEQAYKIEIPETVDEIGVVNQTEITNIEPVSPILISASLENGQKIAKKCSTCHTFEKDGANKIGPNLYGIIGSKIGEKTGYAFSKALASFGGNWNFENIASFLYKPKDYIAGTKMNLAGLKKVEDRADLILWLRQNADNPIPLQ